MNDKMRGAFELKNPVPKHCYYHPHLNEYLSKTYVEATETLLAYNRVWKRWQDAWQAALQSQQPESETKAGNAAALFEFANSVVNGAYVSAGFDERHVPGIRAAAQYLECLSPQPTPQVPEGWREQLQRIRDLISAAPEDALGTGTAPDCPPWSRRDEVVYRITTLLAAPSIAEKEQ